VIDSETGVNGYIITDDGEQWGFGYVRALDDNGYRYDDVDKMTGYVADLYSKVKSEVDEVGGFPMAAASTNGTTGENVTINLEAPNYVNLGEEIDEISRSGNSSFVYRCYYAESGGTLTLNLDLDASPSTVATKLNLEAESVNVSFRSSGSKRFTDLIVVGAERGWDNLTSKRRFTDNSTAGRSGVSPPILSKVETRSRVTEQDELDLIADGIMAVGADSIDSFTVNMSGDLWDSIDATPGQKIGCFADAGWLSIDRDLTLQELSRTVNSDGVDIVTITMGGV